MSANIVSANSYVIRRASDADAEELRRLAELDSQSPLEGMILIGEVAGEAVAALSVTEDRAIADPSIPTGHLLAEMRVQARDMRSQRRRLRSVGASDASDSTTGGEDGGERVRASDGRPVIGLVSAPAGTALEPGRLGRAKWAYTTRRVAQHTAATLLTEGVTPRAGDLMLARVERLGQHERLELQDSRRAQLFPDDEIVVCYGNRYAPDQFEAEVPTTLADCDLVAAGGIAASMLSRHGRMNEPTRIRPLGLLGDDMGGVLNLSRWALRAPAPPAQRPPTVAVVGTSMNAGKTTMAVNLVRGLATSGRRVGAAKITGTGAGGDIWLLRDAGADPALDFTDAGHASTYLAGEAQVEEIFTIVTAELAAAGAEVIVLEIADGVYQAETSALLRSRRFVAGVDQILFAGGDAAGVVAGVTHLRAQGHHVAAVGGMLSSSPLAAREAVHATGLPVLDNAALRRPDALPGLVERLDVAA